MAIKNANSYPATLDKVSNDSKAYGGPFQTVLLIGTYHHLFWGSDLSSSAYYSHSQILNRLSKITTDRLIFSARLDLNRLHSAVREKAKMLGCQDRYNTAYFLKRAQEFFHVNKVGYLDRTLCLSCQKTNLR